MNYGPDDHAAGRSEGDVLRDAGMTLAAARKQWQIWRGQLALLDRIRANPDHTATTDDATADIRAVYLDGGKWRGSIPKQLAEIGLIERIGWTKSSRPHRHSGTVCVWRGLDDDAIDARREELRRLLAAAPTEVTLSTTDELTYSI